MSNPREILEAIHSNLRDSFAQIRKVHYNQNRKGYDYELVLAEYLENYLGNIVEFHTCVGILDRDLNF